MKHLQQLTISRAEMTGGVTSPFHSLLKFPISLFSDLLSYFKTAVPCLINEH